MRVFKMNPYTINGETLLLCIYRNGREIKKCTYYTKQKMEFKKQPSK